MPTAKMFQNKRVIDAKNPLNLTVKPDDIKSAKRKDQESCAIARSAIRGKHVISARIGQRIALIEYSSHFERYVVDRASSMAVKEFDKDGIFVEGDYRLLPVPQSVKLTGKAHVYSGKSGPSGGTKRRRATRNIYKAKECQN